VYYDDDGATYDYEKGSFFRQELQACARENGTSLVLSPRTGGYSPALKWYTFKIHGQACGSLTMDARTVRRLESPQELERSDDEGWAISTDVYGPLTCVKVRAGVARNVRALTGGSRD
jgi:hypothetical protein